MTVTTAILTFAAGAQQFPAAPGIGLARFIYAQPLRSNTHPCYVGISTVTNDASGTGVIKELATPPAATVAVESFTLEDMAGDNRLDPTQFYAHGTSGEKIKVTLIAG
jgi:hypothetical protein